MFDQWDFLVIFSYDYIIDLLAQNWIATANRHARTHTFFNRIVSCSWLFLLMCHLIILMSFGLILILLNLQSQCLCNVHVCENVLLFVCGFVLEGSTVLWQPAIHHTIRSMYEKGYIWFEMNFLFALITSKSTFTFTFIFTSTCRCFERIA